jgi:hypothetical protein
MPPRPLTRLRKLCLSLPEAREVEAWGEPTFRIHNRLFAMYADTGNHHGAGRPAVWCKAAEGNQEVMVRAAPQRFFVPPYVGPSGWVGGRGVARRSSQLGRLEELLKAAYRLVAPKKLRAAVK